jgi:hypothetical protein
MHTSPWVWNVTHVIEETTHFSNAQLIIGFHSTSASVEEGKVIFSTFNRFKRSPVFTYILQKVE